MLALVLAGLTVKLVVATATVPAELDEVVTTVEYYSLDSGPHPWAEVWL